MQLIDTNKLVLSSETHYKKSDIAIVNRLKSYIKDGGQLKNIVIKEIQNDKYAVIEGSKIFEACRQLKHKRIWCSITPEENNTNIISLQINELRGETDYLVISQILNKLKLNERELINLLPFHQQLIKPIVSLLEFDWTKIRKKGKRSQGQLFETDSLVAEKKQDQIDEQQESEPKPSRQKQKKVIVRKEHPCEFENCPKKEQLENLGGDLNTLYCNNCKQIISYER